MHIINNPMSSKYGDAEESVVHVNSFDNPNHIQLPSSAVGEGQNVAVNSCTYNKRDRRSRVAK